VISTSLESNHLVIRLSGSDRFLAWPEPSEIAVPVDLIIWAGSYPALTALPDVKGIFWSVGRGFRTLPVVPGRWAFGRRRTKSGRFYFALRGRDTPVLVTRASNWLLDGVIISTPEAGDLAGELSA
jgi:hypothetical protein